MKIKQYFDNTRHDSLFKVAYLVKFKQYNPGKHDIVTCRKMFDISKKQIMTSVAR